MRGHDADNQEYGAAQDHGHRGEHARDLVEERTRVSWCASADSLTPAQDARLVALPAAILFYGALVVLRSAQG